MGKIGKLLVVLTALLLLSVSLTVAVAAYPNADYTPPTETDFGAQPIQPTEPMETQPTAPTETQPTVTTTPSTATTQPDGGEEASALPLPLLTVAIYTLVALLIMVGGGVAILIITKHRTNTPHQH